MLLRIFIPAFFAALLVSGCALVDEHLFPALTGEWLRSPLLVEKEPAPMSGKLPQVEATAVAPMLQPGRSQLVSTGDLVQQAINRPLAVIRFDRPDVSYQGPLYKAVRQALERRPSTVFELVAVSPDRGTSGQTALLASDARRNAERIMRELNSMGLPADRMSLSVGTNANARTTEVHLYVR